MSTPFSDNGGPFGDGRGRSHIYQSYEPPPPRNNLAPRSILGRCRALSLGTGPMHEACARLITRAGPKARCRAVLTSRRCLLGSLHSCKVQPATSCRARPQPNVIPRPEFVHPIVKLGVIEVRSQTSSLDKGRDKLTFYQLFPRSTRSQGSNAGRRRPGV